MKTAIILGLLAFVCGTARGKQEDDLIPEVTKLFAARCAKCHGPGTDLDQEPYLQNESVIRDALDITSFVNLEKPDQSPVIARLTNKDDPMPPSGKMLSQDEVSLIQNWIDANTRKATKRETVSDQIVLKAIVSDLNSLSQTSQKFVRYLTLHNLYNAGDSDSDLDLYRAAVSKMLNSLSYREIAVPNVVGRHSLILRIDLRDYGWTTEKWELVAKHYPYALEGIDRRSEKNIGRLTESRLAWLRADWFVFVTSQAPLYHRLLDLPGGKNAIQTLEKQLGINLNGNLKNGMAMRAGFRNSGVSRANRLIERHELEKYPGAYWVSYDFSPINAGRAQDLFLSPLGPRSAGLTTDVNSVFKHDGGEIIFSLPNGLQAYLLATADGQRLDRAPIEIVQNSLRRDRVILNGISCIGCHSAGMKSPPGKTLESIVDEVGPVTVDLAPNFGARKILEKLYPSPGKLRAAMKIDAERFNLASIKAISAFVSERSEEPVYKLYHRFLRPVTDETFASEFGEGAFLAETLKQQTDDRAMLLLVSMLNRGIGFPRKSFHDTFQQIASEIGFDPIPFEFLAIEEFGDEPPFSSEPGGNNKQPKHERGKPIIVRSQPRADFAKSLAKSSTKLPWGGIMTAAMNSSEITVGDELQLRIDVTSNSYIRVLHFGADGSVTQMFPSALQKDDLVRAGRQLKILDPSTGFQWQTDGKDGPEHVIIAASERPFTDAAKASSYNRDEPFRSLKKEKYMSRGQLKLRPVGTSVTNIRQSHTLPTVIAQLRLSYTLVPKD